MSKLDKEYKAAEKCVENSALSADVRVLVASWYVRKANQGGFIDIVKDRLSVLFKKASIGTIPFEVAELPVKEFFDAVNAAKAPFPVGTVEHSICLTLSEKIKLRYPEIL